MSSTLFGMSRLSLQTLKVEVKLVVIDIEFELISAYTPLKLKNTPFKL